MKKIFLLFFLSLSFNNLLSDNVYYCSGQATMCIRKIDNIWRADVCDSGKFIFTFNEDYSELTYQKKVLGANGKIIKLNELFTCKTVSLVPKKRNEQLLSASNGRITCIDFDGSQLGIPEVIDEIIHFSNNKERFSIYPMHSHSFIMNGNQADFVTFGTCSKYD
ncbi:MAG: hypothetical protein CBD16_02960 [Betaproteobacteria bacterium TMED156]|nr:MAG: hypothetical protein CBD16_02960 [Betaproteobacteria bacterium TMED156]|tara:strand:+ start:222 stop:713 length:492 start_codon:yes stop_codon:yes gene_type:complete